jgi:hypothetical protein
MSPYRDQEDDELTAELGRAMRAAAEVPAGFVAAGKAAFTWRNVDAELAALGHDSATGAALAGTRAERATLRALTFVASRLTIELEVTADALLGQLVPPQPGQIELQQRDGAKRVATVDELGWFVFHGSVPKGMCRLRLTAADGSTVLTEWTTL